MGGGRGARLVMARGVRRAIKGAGGSRLSPHHRRDTCPGDNTRKAERRMKNNNHLFRRNEKCLAIKKKKKKPSLLKNSRQHLVPLTGETNELAGCSVRSFVPPPDNSLQVSFFVHSLLIQHFLI